MDEAFHTFLSHLKYQVLLKGMMHFGCFFSSNFEFDIVFLKMPVKTAKFHTCMILLKVIKHFDHTMLSDVLLPRDQVFPNSSVLGC